MHGQRRTGLLITGLLCIASTLSGQSVTVESILISGLKRTKETIVLRELNFSEGDTLQQRDLGLTLERNRNNLLNLGIFNDVIVNISEWDTDRHHVIISIEIKESWYIYAVPILELADRNFNVWWSTYNRALNRLNLGARMEWLNFSGRNDKLKALFQLGFTPKQEIQYRLPYFNKKQSIGVTMGFLHSVNKEMSYATVNNREQFIRLDERILQERWQGEISSVYRPNIFLKYELTLGFQAVRIHEEIATDYNPLFFRNGDTHHEALSLKFAGEYDDRDLKIFPSEGLKTMVELKKTGWSKSGDENALVGTVLMEYNFHSGRRFQHRISSIGQYSLSRNRPSLMHYDAMGSGLKYVAGYELYIINGLDLIVGKYQLAYKLLEKQINLGRRMPLEQFRRLPVAFYVSVLAESGYVYDPYTGADNSFSNRWLYGGGPAISVLIYNNFLFQFSYCTNHLGERGLFVHNRTSF